MSHSNAGTLQANNVSWKLARSEVHIDSAIEQFDETSDCKPATDIMNKVGYCLPQVQEKFLW
jgi:hypothetical protein